MPPPPQNGQRRPAPPISRSAKASLRHCDDDVDLGDLGFHDHERQPAELTSFWRARALRTCAALRALYRCFWNQHPIGDEEVSVRSALPHIPVAFSPVSKENRPENRFRQLVENGAQSVLPQVHRNRSTGVAKWEQSDAVVRVHNKCVAIGYYQYQAQVRYYDRGRE